MHFQIQLQKSKFKQTKGYTKIERQIRNVTENGLPANITIPDYRACDSNSDILEYRDIYKSYHRSNLGIYISEMYSKLQEVKYREHQQKHTYSAWCV